MDSEQFEAELLKCGVTLGAFDKFMEVLKLPYGQHPLCLGWREEEAMWWLCVRNADQTGSPLGDLSANIVLPAECMRLDYWFVPIQGPNNSLLAKRCNAIQFAQMCKDSTITARLLCFYNLPLLKELKFFDQVFSCFM